MNSFWMPGGRYEMVGWGVDRILIRCSLSTGSYFPSNFISARRFPGFLAASDEILSVYVKREILLGEKKDTIENAFEYPVPADNLKKYKIKQTPNIKVILKTQDLSKIKTIMVFA